MATTRLPPDFKEFLRLLNENGVKYLLVGGYAVGYHGYPRSTGDMDVWVELDPVNAEKLVSSLQSFGFGSPDLTEEVFLQVEKIIRMGLPPFRIEVLTSISGVEFKSCYDRRITDIIDGVPVTIIDRECLRANKLASGRAKDIDDLENLP
jgi:hypothetical protein